MNDAVTASAVGRAAAALMLLTFLCRDARRLRAVAILRTINGLRLPHSSRKSKLRRVSGAVLASGLQS